MGEKGWNGCRSCCRGTSLRGRFPHGSGNGDDSRRDMRQTHCAAKPNAARCDERCSALRWTMHCTTSFHPSHSHEAKDPTTEPHSRPSVCKDHASPTRPYHRNPASYPPKTPVVPAPRDRPTDCQKEYEELKNRTGRAKRPNDERRTRGRGGPRGRTEKDEREDGAGQKTERRKRDERTERDKRPNEERRARGRSGLRGRAKSCG